MTWLIVLLGICLILRIIDQIQDDSLPLLWNINIMVMQSTLSLFRKNFMQPSGCDLEPEEENNFSYLQSWEIQNLILLIHFIEPI